MSDVLRQWWCSLLTVRKPVIGVDKTLQSIARSTVPEGVEVGLFVGADRASCQDALAHALLGYGAESQ